MSVSSSLPPSSSRPRAVTFGTYHHLVGVFNPGVAAGPQSIAVIQLTAGMLPSSGPFRMHVDLANSLAAQGVPSLRFDLSGIGESLAIGSMGTSLERTAAEISEAIDYLEQQEQVERFALFGLCSGADDALFAALHDDRIQGIFSIDGCGYRTAKYYAHRLRQNYLPKLTSGRAWASRVGRLLGREQPVVQSLKPGTDLREFPDRQTAAAQLAQLVERGVRMHFHYTGGVGDYYNYRDQFADMFADTPLSTSGAIRKIGTSFSPESDHVGFLVEHRERVVNLATEKLIAMLSVC